VVFVDPPDLASASLDRARGSFLVDRCDLSLGKTHFVPTVPPTLYCIRGAGPSISQPRRWSMGGWKPLLDFDVFFFYCIS
jgi:hypothetical protein